MAAVNLAFPRKEEKFSLRQAGLFAKVPLLAQPNVPEKSRQQPGSPWLLRDDAPQLVRLAPNQIWR